MPVVTGIDEPSPAGWPPDHELLALEAARAAGLTVAAVVLTPWPSRPSAVERSNRETIARLGEVEVAALPAVGRPEPVPLAEVGEGLALDRWLGPERLG